MRVLFVTILFECAFCNTTVHFNKKSKSAKDISNVTTTPSDVGTLYLPKWEDLDTRPLPQWYDSAKIGIFIHWGIYSVAGKGEWLWYKMVAGDADITSFMHEKYGKRFNYEDFAPLFIAKSFNPNKWAKLFAKSGARYVVLTAKHHDGFALFPSKRPSWNSVDVGPKKDIVQVLSKAVRKYNMKFGIYYSLFEWFNQLFLNDKDSGYKTTKHTDEIVWPDIQYLIENYKPSLLWGDGESDASDTYWKSPQLLAWLYNESPVKNDIVVNDRWGKDTNCNHGDFYNCKDRYNPRHHGSINHKWENAFSLDKHSWGYRIDMVKDDDVLSDHELLEEVVSTVSCGGNALINIGPTKQGTISPIFQMRLLRLGKWLKTYGEAIYGSSAWYHQRDTFNADIWYTCTKKEYHPLTPINTPDERDVIEAIYAIFLKWPADDKLRLKDLLVYLKNDERYIVQMMLPKGYEFIEYIFLNDTIVLDLSTKHNISSGVLKISIYDGYTK